MDTPSIIPQELELARQRIGKFKLILTTTAMSLVLTGCGATNALTKAPASNYKDGKYEAVGRYNSPAGPETVDVSVTLKNNLIEDAEVTGQATNPRSVKFQNLFVSGFREFVVGKNINEVDLGKVSGSSLTPKGFNDALEKIKTEAVAS